MRSNQAKPRPSSGRSSGRARSTANWPNDSIASDCSTPKTTRTLRTPATFKNGRRVMGIVEYKPLELDNDSNSSEAADIYSRRRDNIRRNSQITTTPTPIKCKTPLAERGQTRMVTGGKKRKILAIEGGENLIQALEDKIVDLSSEKELPPPPPPPPEIIECITPPITPEKSKAVNEEEPVVVLNMLPNFIPGNCNVEEVLRLYGSAKKCLKKDPTNEDDNNDAKAKVDAKAQEAKSNEVDQE